MPASTFRLPEDSLMPKILDRHRIVSSGFEVPGRTGLVHLTGMDPDVSAAFGIGSRESAFASSIASLEDHTVCSSESGNYRVIA
jgi:hypothetical protein